MSKPKLVRNAVVMVQLAHADDDPTSIEARVLGVKDRQVFYALQRYVFHMQREFSAAVRAHSREARARRIRCSPGDIRLPLPFYDCGND